ncbi:hypothetical protein FRB94_006704 [Tulasnella sp. JGI-2019a]|nr:hypothetical protein FRB94_006704 [Tulasnella sp. JGI-2019a]
MSNYTSSTTPMPAPVFNDSPPCMTDLICDGLSPSVVQDACLPAIQYLVENHPSDSFGEDTCLRTCSKFLRTDLDSINHINSLLPFGWSLMAAPSLESTVHRRRQEKRQIETLNEQCKAFLLKVQKRFMNHDGSNGSVTMMFLHLLNNTSDRNELRRNVRALFQWHPDLCRDFNAIFCPSNIIGARCDDAAEEPSSSQFVCDIVCSVLEGTDADKGLIDLFQDPFGLEVENTQSTSDRDHSTAVMLRTPSPVPSLTMSGDRSSASSMSPPSRLPTTPTSLSHALRADIPSYSNSPDESWISSFIFTPPTTFSPEGLGLGLLNKDETPIEAPPTTAQSLMDRHLTSAHSPSISNSKARVPNQPPTIVSSSTLDDTLVYSFPPTSTALFGHSEYNPNVLPSFASLDKDICGDAFSFPPFILEDQELTTTATRSNSKDSAYAPVLHPFGVTHGRTVQFDSDSWSASTPISKIGRAKAKGQKNGHVEGQSAKVARSVRGVESWVDVTVPRAAAASWESSPYGAVGDGRPKNTSERKAPSVRA